MVREYINGHNTTTTLLPTTNALRYQQLQNYHGIDKLNNLRNTKLHTKVQVGALYIPQYYLREKIVGKTQQYIYINKRFHRYLNLITTVGIKTSEFHRMRDYQIGSVNFHVISSTPYD